MTHLTTTKYSIWFRNNTILGVTTTSHRMALKLNRWFGKDYEKITIGDEPVFYFPITPENLKKVQRILRMKKNKLVDWVQNKVGQIE
jgi:hypothetical protein